MPCADKTVIWENYKIGICQAGLDNKTGGTQLRLSAACFCAAMGRKSHPVPRRSVRWSHCHFLSDSLRQASFASIHFIQNYSRSSKTDERRQWSRWTAAPPLTSVRLFRFLANKAAVAADFHLRKWRLLLWRTENSKHSRCMYTLRFQAWQAMHVWTHIVLYANFSVAAFCKNLLGNIPNPLTIFSKSATLLRSWTSLYLGKWSRSEERRVGKRV